MHQSVLKNSRIQKVVDKINRFLIPASVSQLPVGQGPEIDELVEVLIDDE
jgi:hypothetical protein